MLMPRAAGSAESRKKCSEVGRTARRDGEKPGGPVRGERGGGPRAGCAGIDGKGKARAWNVSPVSVYMPNMPISGVCAYVHRPKRALPRHAAAAVLGHPVATH